MNHRIILRSAAVVATLYGIILVIAPNTLMAMYRSQMVEGPGMFFAMLSGAMLLGWGVMNWAASNAPEIAEIHYVLLGNLVAQAIALLVALFRQLTHAGAPESGWLNVAVFLAFTALFGWLYMSSPAGYRLHARSRPA
jgi:CDP-diglyceride synthetase